MKRHDFLLQPLDRSRIELIEDHELQFWTCELDCSAEHLLDAIEAVGVDAGAVGGYLAMRRDSAAPVLLTQRQTSATRPLGVNASRIWP